MGIFRVYLFVFFDFIFIFIFVRVFYKFHITAYFGENYQSIFCTEYHTNSFNPWVKQEFSINKGTPGTVSNNDTGLGSLPVDGVVGLSAVGASWVGLEVEVWNSAKTTKKVLQLLLL